MPLPITLEQYREVFPEGNLVWSAEDFTRFAELWNAYEIHRDSPEWLFHMSHMIGALSLIRLSAEGGLNIYQNRLLAEFGNNISGELRERVREVLDDPEATPLHRLLATQVLTNITNLARLAENDIDLAEEADEARTRFLEKIRLLAEGEFFWDNPFAVGLVGVVPGVIVGGLTGGWGLVPILLGGGGGFTIGFGGRALVDIVFCDGEKWRAFLENHPYQAAAGFVISGLTIGAAASVVAGELAANEAAIQLLTKIANHFTEVAGKITAEALKDTFVALSTHGRLVTAIGGVGGFIAGAYVKAKRSKEFREELRKGFESLFQIFGMCYEGTNRPMPGQGQV